MSDPSTEALPCPMRECGAWPLPASSGGGVPGDLAPGYAVFRGLMKIGLAEAPRWGAAAQAGARILATSSKDLGIAADLAIALWLDRRIEGVSDALQIWTDLLSPEVWPHVHPRAQQARVAQIRHFTGRLAANLHDAARVGFAAAELRSVSGAVEQLQVVEGAIERCLGGEAASSLHDLRELRRALYRPPPPPPPPPTADGVQVFVEQLSVAESMLEAQRGKLALEVLEPWATGLRDPIWNLTRALIDRAPGFAPAWALARTLAWTFVSAPDAPSGRLPAEAGAADLVDAWRELSRTGRQRPGAPIELLWQQRPWLFWLGPHAVAAEALAAGGYGAAARAIGRQVAALLARAPTLPGLQFDDPARTRLADEPTRRWLATLPAAPIAVESVRQPAPAVSGDVRDLNRASQRLVRDTRATLGGAASGAGPVDRAFALLRGPMQALLSAARCCDPNHPEVIRLHLAWAYCSALGPVLGADGKPAVPMLLLPAPDEEVWATLTALADYPDDLLPVLWQAILERPLWLDAQRLLAELLKRQGHRASLSALEFAIDELIEIAPGVLELRFDTGAPVAAEQTRAWIEELRAALVASGARAPEAGEAAPGQGATPTPDVAVVSSTAAAAPQSPMEAGLALLRGGRVAEALAAFEAAYRTTLAGRTRFLSALEIANAAIEVGRLDLATPVVESLDDVVNSIGLGTWEPPLVADLLAARTRLIAARDAEPDTSPTEQRALRRTAAAHGVYTLLRSSSD